MLALPVTDFSIVRTKIVEPEIDAPYTYSSTFPIVKRNRNVIVRIMTIGLVAIKKTKF